MTMPPPPDTSAEPTSLPANKMPELRVIPRMADSNNVQGDIFGGWIMSQVDLAGAIPAIRRSNGRAVTVAVNSFLFKNPVFLGDICSFYADIIKIGRTSITVKVEVYAERNRIPTEIVKVTEATLTYVAIDDERRPRVVPAMNEKGEFTA